MSGILGHKGNYRGNILISLKIDIIRGDPFITFAERVKKVDQNANAVREVA